MKNWLRKTILSVAILIFVVSFSLLIKLLVFDPYVSNKIQNEAKDLYYNSSPPHPSENTIGKFTELLKINNEIKGWIKINNTIIDYPVTQSENSTFYLEHNYKKETSRYGSIFIDSACKNGANSKNIILHGHHMRDGQMFAGLLKFSDLDFYKTSPVITFDSIDRDMKWKIISIFKTNTLPDQGKIFNYLVFSFMNDESFLNYVYKIRIRSLIDIPVDINENDQLITLSTCSYEFNDFRTVLVARKVRLNESESVDTESAKKATNPLMPECWYKKYGGSPPVYSDFYSDYKSGKIPWYQ